MRIEPATAQQAAEIFDILRKCRRALEKNHIFQWTDAYPTLQHVEQDIDSGCLFCYMNGDTCLGTVIVNTHQDPEYQTVNWADTENPCRVIHRLAVYPQHQGQGIAKSLMDFAEDLARQQGAASIRLDAYSGNPRSLRFYEKRGYINRGTVYFQGRDLHFYCYEKSI